MKLRNIREFLKLLFSNTAFVSSVVAVLSYALNHAGLEDPLVQAITAVASIVLATIGLYLTQKAYRVWQRRFYVSYSPSPSPSDRD